MNTNRSDFYKRYIRSDEWKQKEQDRMKVDDYKCDVRKTGR